MSKKTLISILVIVLAALGGLYYWFFVRVPVINIDTSSGSSENGGSIFGTTGGTGTGGDNSAATGQQTSTSPGDQQVPTIPALRELSTTPVGGMTASTTSTSTIVRWVDRGTGKVYQTYSNSLAVDELSNTTVPQVYSTYWNSSASAFILQSMTDTSDKVTTFYTALYPVSQSASSTPFELRGSPLPSATVSLAVSPKKDSVVTLENADGLNGTTIGYVSQFNGAKKTKIFSTPLTDLNIEWPEASTIAVTTKGSSVAPGFLYFINPANGIFNKILGNVPGLSTLTSKNAGRVLYTASVNGGIKTSLYDVAAGTSQDMIFNTMPEKCVWSSLLKDVLYCAVPTAIPDGTYPDDWYKGTISFSDSIWEVNAATGSAHQIANILSLSGSIIDATNLVLDPSENYLYFTNKKNLTLWSLELNG